VTSTCRCRRTGTGAEELAGAGEAVAATMGVVPYFVPRDTGCQRRVPAAIGEEAPSFAR
jgi:hypothetical protein